MDKPKTGGPGAPTLVKKSVTEFTVTPDVQRIMGMKADPEGYNPEINQPITDPGARTYAARIQERAAMKATAAALKGKKIPLGHVESPPPEKMMAIAGLSSDDMPRPNFMEPPPVEQAFEPPAPQQGPAIKGVGAAYPINQAMAQGKVDRPVSLREANKMAQQGGFSKETVQALEMANENIKKGQAEKPAEPPPEPAKTPAPSVAQKVSEELDEAERSLPSPAGLLDMAEVGNIRTGLMSQKRREEIEKGLKPLDIGDMVMKREIVQTIPVIPGKFEVTLRTFSQRENLWILRYIFDFPGSGLYISELINTCRLVCGLVAINGAYLPDHRKDVGLPTETIIKEDFERKFFHVAGFPVQFVADMSVQSIWFQDRIDKLFTADALKNG
jgi:hypothetical protein